MKKILFIFATLNLFACSCLDCGTSVFKVNSKEFIIKHDIITPNSLIVTSSYEWNGISSKSDYFSNIYNSHPGTNTIPITLSDKFYDDFHNGIVQEHPTKKGYYEVTKLILTSSNGDKIQVIFYYVDEKVSEPESYITITYYSNTIPNITKEIGYSEDDIIKVKSASELEMTNPTKKFVGWNTNATGSGKFYTYNEILTSDIVLYAMWSGDGLTEKSPIYIYNYRTLNEVRNHLSVSGSTFNEPPLHYLVVADFNANYDEENDKNHLSWIPLGNSTPSDYRFQGVFNGNGHHITYVVHEEVVTLLRHVGLFGIITGTNTVIKNLTVSGNIKGVGIGGASGGIAGGLFGGTITHCVANCYVEHNQSGTDCIDGAGGIVGDIRANATISYCVSKGAVICYHPGNKSMDYAFAGGIAGKGAGNINNCITTSFVCGYSGRFSYVGGIVGGRESTSTSDERIENNVALNGIYDSAVYDIKSEGGSEDRSLLYRIAGQQNTFTIANNYALDNMIIKRFNNPTMKITDPSAIGLNKLHGANVSQSSLNKEWYLSIGYDEINWDYSDIFTDFHPVPKYK